MSVINIKKPFYILIVLLFTTVCLAAPSKPTVLVGSTTLTITGSSFGTKTVAGPTVWDNFDSGTDGQNIGSRAYTSGSGTNNWTAFSADGGDPPKYQASGTRTGSTVHAYFAMNGGDDDSYLRSIDHDADWGRYVYLDFWLYHDLTLTDLGGPCSYKSFAIYRWNAPLLSLSIQDSGGWVLREDRPNENPCVDTVSGVGTAESPTWIQAIGDQDKWQHYRIQIDFGVNGGASGDVEIWIDGGYDSEPTVTNWLATPNCEPRWFRTGYAVVSCEGGSDGAWIKIDNVYVDNGWARVFVSAQSDCDSDFAGCNDLAPQPPTAWSATSITVTTNQDAFGDDDIAYLYVVDSDGDIGPASNSFTFGDSATPSTSGVTIN